MAHTSGRDVSSVFWPAFEATALVAYVFVVDVGSHLDDRAFLLIAICLSKATFSHHDWSNQNSCRQTRPWDCLACSASTSSPTSHDDHLTILRML